MAGKIAIKNDGVVQVHIRFEAFGYATLCGMDGNDVAADVDQRTVELPRNAKVDCPHCRGIWVAAKLVRASEFQW